MKEPCMIFQSYIIVETARQIQGGCNPFPSSLNKNISLSLEVLKWSTIKAVTAADFATLTPMLKIGVFVSSSAYYASKAFSIDFFITVDITRVED